MAYFTAREGQPAAYCRQQVEQADVYVGVIGFRYGSPVSDQPDVSYTELEFDAATQRALPRLVFLLDENATLPLPRSFTFDPQFEDRQQAFRSRLLAAGVIVQRVASPKDLELMLFQALTEVRRDKQAQETQTRINSGLALARRPMQREVVRRVRFVNPPPMVTPGWFQDRHLETRVDRGVLAGGWAAVVDDPWAGWDREDRDGVPPAQGPGSGSAARGRRRVVDRRHRLPEPDR